MIRVDHARLASNDQGPIEGAPRCLSAPMPRRVESTSLCKSTQIIQRIGNVRKMGGGWRLPLPACATLHTRWQ